MTKLNKAQQQAVLNLWQRNHNDQTFLQFRRTVTHGLDTIMVNWAGMWIGIETDGYTHS